MSKQLSWSEQYRHPNWQRKRLEALSVAQWECQNCGARDVTLNVHHKRYVKGRQAWDYELTELAVLCEPCHEVEHQSRDLLMRLIADGAATTAAVSLIGGYLYAAYDIDEALAEMARQTDKMFFELGVTASVLEGRPEEWREIVRKANARHPNPALKNLIHMWDEIEGDA